MNEKLKKISHEKLYPSCSEYIFKLGIKKFELPYIKKRVNDFYSDKNDRKYLLDEFVKMVNKSDIEIDFISEGDVEPYNKIKNELLAKRNCEICPFCKENIGKFPNHLKEFHKEEIKLVLKDISKEEYLKIKKEIVIDNL